jgi:hypothetical protein
MAEVHGPRTAEIASAVSTSGVDKDALINRLDALLEQYLNTLDEYEKLMQQLAKQLSSVCSHPYMNVTPINTDTGRVTSPSPKQTSTTALACTTDKTATMNVCRRHGRCMRS